MPGINGVEAPKTIRTVAPHPSVIMMTAVTSDELDIARVLDLIGSRARPGRVPGGRI